MTRQDWRTVPGVYFDLEERFGAFDLDVAADDTNNLCGRYYTKKQNALIRPWDGHWFNNVPFGSPLAWVRKAVNETILGRSGVLLCLGGLSPRWFHLAIQYADLHVPDRRINYWHPDEAPFDGDGDRRMFDRDSIVLEFGPRRGGKICSYHVKPHADEILSLWAKANGTDVGRLTRDAALRREGARHRKAATREGRIIEFSAVSNAG